MIDYTPRIMDEKRKKARRKTAKGEKVKTSGF
jgi:hypothetical protein